MKILSLLVAFILISWPLPSFAGGTAESDATKMTGYDVVFLGETHDNPHHHARQSAIVAALLPKAIVWEMLTQEQAAEVTEALDTPLKIAVFRSIWLGLRPS